MRIVVLCHLLIGTVAYSPGDVVDVDDDVVAKNLLAAKSVRVAVEDDGEPLPPVVIEPAANGKKPGKKAAKTPVVPPVEPAAE